MLRATLHPHPPLTPDCKSGTSTIAAPPQILTRSWDDLYAWAESMAASHPGHAVHIYEIAESLRAVIPTLENRKKLGGYECVECGKEYTVKKDSVCRECRKKQAQVEGRGDNTTRQSGGAQ